MELLSKLKAKILNSTPLLFTKKDQYSDLQAQGESLRFLVGILTNDKLNLVMACYVSLLTISFIFMGSNFPEIQRLHRYILAFCGLWLTFGGWAWISDRGRVWRLILAACPLGVCVWTQFAIGGDDLLTLTLQYAVMVMGGVYLQVGELVFLSAAIMLLHLKLPWDYTIFSLANFCATLSAGWFSKGLILLNNQSVEIQSRLQNQYERDRLTDLYNRDYVLNSLHARLEQKEGLFILLSDLHNYRALNQHFGPNVGDAVLKVFVAFCAKIANKEWILGRFGADELLFILPESQDGPYWVKLFRQAQTGLHYEYMDNVLPIYASYGWANYPEDGQTVHELIQAAERRKMQHNIPLEEGEKSLELLREKHGIPYGVDIQSDLRRSLYETLSSKDVYSSIHSKSVADYLLQFADYLSLDTEKSELWRAGMLHDIGKLVIPDRILKKPGRLESAEYSLMTQHPLLGFDLIGRWVEQSTVVASAVFEHHERWDGKGYPKGKKGEEISLIGRIVAIVDAYSAMTLDRTYHRGRSMEEALLEIERGEGSQFDPILAQQFIRMLRTSPNSMSVSSL
jgi:diguanylate cyclase (GGDEF)-like protein